MTSFFQAQINTKKNITQKYCLNIQTDSNKNEMYKAIKENNVQAVLKLVKVFGFQAHEECSVNGYFWNILHYACHFNRGNILEYFIKRTYKYHPNQYINIVNEKSLEGWTPLMITAIYGSTKCLDILLKAGGIQLNLQDNQKKTVKDLANYYKRTEILTKLKDEFKKPIFTINGIQHTAMDLNYLQSFDETFFESQSHIKNNGNIKYICCTDITIEDNHKFNQLLLSGDRRDCMICLTNLGYIKYTTCCGQPIHILCKKSSIRNCPNCKSYSWNLTSEINYPERAYSLDNLNLQYAYKIMYNVSN